MQSQMNLKSVFISLFPNTDVYSVEKAVLSVRAVKGPDLRTGPV